MKVSRHGLTVGIERLNDHFCLFMKVRGKLTHEDYEVMVPMVESALYGIKNPEIDALVDVSELDGWELRAAWEDLKFGLSHGNEFHKIAILGHSKLIKMAASVGGWFISGEIQYFEENEKALEWLGC